MHQLQLISGVRAAQFPQVMPDGLSHYRLGVTPLDPSGGTVHSRQKEHLGGSVKSP